MFEQHRYYQYSRRKLVLALTLSALVHVPLILFFHFNQPNASSTTTVDSKRPLKVTVVRESELKKKKKEKKKKEEHDPKLQHVSAPKPEIEKTPKEAKFADRYASEVDRQTVRKSAPGAPVPTESSPNVSPSDSPDANVKATVPQKIEALNNPELESKEDDGQRATQEPKKGLVIKDPNAVESKSESLDPKSLFPRLANSELYSPNGQGGTLDYLRDVDEGEKTLLNRKRTRYWAFFDRVKTQIARQWSPQEEYRQRDPYGNVFGVKDRYSAVSVTLNSDGSVRQLYVHRGSGLDFFDDEAIRSIRSAAPFHNPPEGLKDEDGLVHFRFGFYFEISSGRFQMQRLFR